MGIRGLGAGWVAAACLAIGSGCFDAPDEAKERLARVKAEGAELERSLDDVEERLLGNQARMHLWQELGRRHQHVSALACENVSDHVQEMAAHLDKQAEKTRRLRAARVKSRSDRVSAVPTRSQKTRSN